MAFWLERFKKEDEDDIWEGLKQMLLNPSSEQEIAQKKQQEQAQIDAALERMFPDIEKPKTEPYLKYEDLFPQQAPITGVPTGLAAPAKSNITNSIGIKNNVNLENATKAVVNNLKNNAVLNQMQGSGQNNVSANIIKAKNDLSNLNTALKSKFDNAVKPNPQANGLKPANSKKIPNKVDIAEAWEKKKDTLINNKIDYSSPFTTKEKLVDFAVQNPITRSLYQASSDLYADGMTGLSRAQNNSDAVILNNYSSLDENTIKQLRNYGVSENLRGVHYSPNSKIAKLIAEAPEIIEFVENNIDDIKQGKITEHPFEFKTSRKDMFSDKKRFDRGNSIQHGKMWNMKIDNGTFSARVGDLVDYSKRDVNSFSDFMNNHGYSMQEKGNFENYFTLIDFLIKLKEEEKEENNK